VKPKALEDTELFRLFAPRIEQIRPHLKRRPFEEGEYLYHESQPAEYLWTVRSGEVRTLKGTATGRITTLEVLFPGDPFGMSAMSPGACYAESAQGVLRGEVWRLPRRVVASLLKADPEVGRALLSIVAGRLQQAHDRLCSFAHASVTERLAHVLLESVDSERIETTRRLLGEAAGTTVETAIRVLRRFERSGWVEGGVGWIRVIDREALASVARGESPEERDL
jgi:CRP/FNR family transcriptional regulator